MTKPTLSALKPYIPPPDRGTIPARTVIEAPEEHDWNARYDASWPPNEAADPAPATETEEDHEQPDRT